MPVIYVVHWPFRSFRPRCQTTGVGRSDSGPVAPSSAKPCPFHCLGEFLRRVQPIHTYRYLQPLPRYGNRASWKVPPRRLMALPVHGQRYHTPPPFNRCLLPFQRLQPPPGPSHHPVNTSTIHIHPPLKKLLSLSFTLRLSSSHHTLPPLLLLFVSPKSSPLSPLPHHRNSPPLFTADFTTIPTSSASSYSLHVPSSISLIPHRQSFWCCFDPAIPTVVATQKFGSCFLIASDRYSTFCRSHLLFLL